MNSSEEVAVNNQEVELTDAVSEHLKNPVVRNTDNEFLGQLRGPGFTIGHVDEVNGRGAEEIQGFIATRHELIQLAKYWAKKAIDIEYFWFLYEQTGSSDRRIRAFAWRRVSRIAELVGKEVNEAVKQAYDEFGEGFKSAEGKRAWNIFLNGTPEERKALQDEVYAEMDTAMSKKNEEDAAKAVAELPAAE